jgi:hypothetical protein
MMICMFGAERVGVVLSDLYFRDPRPELGQEGAERGVRLELRLLERGDIGGSVYASQPITMGQPLWRVDLLESIGRPGSLDRAHHHPRLQGWEPGRRQFEETITADPLTWLARQLEHLPEVVDHELEDADRAEIARLAPEIVAAVRRTLDRIVAGELAREPVGAGDAPLVRSGWL